MASVLFFGCLPTNAMFLWNRNLREAKLFICLEILSMDIFEFKFTTLKYDIFIEFFLSMSPSFLKVSSLILLYVH